MNKYHANDFHIGQTVGYLDEVDDIFAGRICKITQEKGTFSVWVQFHEGAPYVEFPFGERLRPVSISFLD